MPIKLCYKEYDYKLTNGACKSFFDKTGLDLQIVLADYLDTHMQAGDDQTLIGRMVTLGKLYTLEVVNQLFYAVIKPCHEEVSYDEICDATYRVGWQLSSKPDDMGEPYPIAILNLAFEYNDYCHKNIPQAKKKVEAT